MKRYIILSIFLISLFFVWGQKGKVQLIVSPEEVGVNQPVTITIKSNVEGDIVENWPSNFVKNQGVQSQSSYVQDFNTGKMQQEHIVVFSGVFSKIGKYQFGPFYVKYGNKTYSSNKVKVEVTQGATDQQEEEISKRDLRKPAFGVYEVSAKKIYEGQPLVIAGRVYSKERTYGRPILRRQLELDGVADYYPLHHLESWETVNVKGKEYESFAFERKVCFPIGNGRIHVQPFEVYLPFNPIEGYNVVSSVPIIEVIPLPANAPKEFIGAVGTFEVAIDSKVSTAKQGDIIPVEVVVSGKGNLHAIETPILHLPSGMSTYGDVEVKDDYSFTANGSSGKMTYTYHVQVTKSGNQIIQPLKIAYFDPADEVYKMAVSAKSIALKVQPNSQFSIGHDSTSQLVTEHIGKSINSQESSSSNWYFWFGVGGIGVAIASLLFLLFRPRVAPGQIASSAKTEQPTPLTSVRVNSAQLSELFNQVQFYAKEDANDQFYTTLEKLLVALMQFQLKTTSAEQLTRSELVANYSTSHTDAAKEVTLLLQQCDSARYGMQLSNEDKISLVHQVEELM